MASPRPRPRAGCHEDRRQWHSAHWGAASSGRRSAHRRRWAPCALPRQASPQCGPVRQASHASALLPLVMHWPVLCPPQGPPRPHAARTRCHPHQQSARPLPGHPRPTQIQRRCPIGRVPLPPPPPHALPPRQHGGRRSPRQGTRGNVLHPRRTPPLLPAKAPRWSPRQQRCLLLQHSPPPHPRRPHWPMPPLSRSRPPGCSRARRGATSPSQLDSALRTWRTCCLCRWR
mmetsp:Transcript_47578/g.107228  ORF Transcript_47578/g.107228 Transcript_47578/m.107228 type:complete len:230 (-) Transcript_47578:120-809(-)